MMEVAVATLVWREVGRDFVHPAAPRGCATIAYVTDGIVGVALPGRGPRACRAGMMMLIPAGLEVTFSVGESEALPRLVIAGAAVGLSGSGLLDRVKAPIFADLSPSPLVEPCIDELVRLADCEPKPLGAEALSNSLMKTCILALLQDFFGRPGIDLKIVAALAEPRLAAVIAAVLERPQDDHSLARMAALSGLGRSTFSRLFGAAMGQSPIEFVTKTRLYYAAELLRVSDLPIKAVAATVGFSSRSHFSRAFSEAYGIDPTRYRQDNAAERPAPIPQSLKTIEATAGRAL